MTAADTHAAALATLRAALEVEDPLPEWERAWLWSEATDETLAGHGYHMGQMLYRLPLDGQTRDMQTSIEAMLAALASSRAILRPALEGAIETLEQHRPQRTTAPHCDPDCVGPHYGFTRWPCSAARHALVITEAAGGAA